MSPWKLDALLLFDQSGICLITTSGGFVTTVNPPMIKIEVSKDRTPVIWTIAGLYNEWLTMLATVLFAPASRLVVADTLDAEIIDV